MTLTQLYPQRHADSPSVTEESLRELYRPPSRDWVRSNLIRTIDGSVTGADGTSNSITNRLDRVLLGIIRDQADAVLVGAQTIRAEGYNQPVNAALVIVTGTGDLGRLSRHSDADAGNIYLLTPRSREAVVRRAAPDGVTVAQWDDRSDTPDGNIIVAACRDLGFRSIVCEGGPTLLNSLVAASALDELCLTTAPVLSAHRAESRSSYGDTHPHARAASLTSLLLDENSFQYARWRVGPAATR